jgi:molybdate transport system substrate-binding protein
MSRSIKLMSALPIKGAFAETIGPSLQAAGIDCSVEWLPTKLILERLMQNEACDVVFALDDGMHALTKSGKLDASSSASIVSSGYGLAVRAGDSHPDVGNVDALRATLLAARSVAFSKTGASGIYFDSVLDQLGIADRVKERATLINSGLTAETLVTGQADIAIQQISELLSVTGIEIVGPFPDPLQQTITFSAAVSNLAEDISEAKRVIAALVSPAAAVTYRKFGLTPLF